MKFVLRKECNFEVKGKMRSGLRLKTTKRKALVTLHLEVRSVMCVGAEEN